MYTKFLVFRTGREEFWREKWFASGMHEMVFILLFGFAFPFFLQSSIVLSYPFGLQSTSVLPNPSGPRVGFYQYTCPNAKVIVRDEMTKIISQVPSLAGPLLRMHFHDCFVNGCDGSILLNSTPGSPSEKESVPNLSLRGFGTIDRVKAKLEQACPGVVSCADILALVARDVVVLTKGPHWDVPTGRRDGRRSVEQEALDNLPPPFFDAAQNLNQFFIPKGLDAKDQVVLLGILLFFRIKSQRIISHTKMIDSAAFSCLF
ncbi:hypothetical protein EJB05_39740, partial [Eragrostis curvula]